MAAGYASAASGELAIGVIGWWFIVAIADQLTRPSTAAGHVDETWLERLRNRVPPSGRIAHRFARHNALSRVVGRDVVAAIALPDGSCARS